MTAGRSQMLATTNFGQWHTVVGEVTWSSVLKTTMDCHSKLVLHSLRNNQPVQVVVHQPRQTVLVYRPVAYFLPQIRSSPCGTPQFRTVFVYFTWIRTFADTCVGLTLCRYLSVRICSQACAVPYGAVRYHADICVWDTRDTERCLKAQTSGV